MSEENSGLIAEYGAYLERRGRSVTTIRLYTSTITRLARFAGDRSLRTLCPSLMYDWLDSLLLGPSSREQYRTYVRQFSNWLFLQEYTESDRLANEQKQPVPSTLPKYIPLELVPLFFPDEPRNSFHSGKKWMRFLRSKAISSLLLYGGLRRGEACGLRCRYVDRHRGEVTIPAMRAKRKKGRVVPMPEEGIPPLQTYLEELYGDTREVPDAFVFPGEENGYSISPRRLADVFRGRALAAGVPPELAHPHAARHTAALMLIDGGAPLSVVQAFLGHASINTTAIYLRLRPDDVAAAVRLAHSRRLKG